MKRGLGVDPPTEGSKVDDIVVSSNSFPSRVLKTTKLVERSFLVAVASLELIQTISRTSFLAPSTPQNMLKSLICEGGNIISGCFQPPNNCLPEVSVA